jgi:hypothetical protein
MCEHVYTYVWWTLAFFCAYIYFSRETEWQRERETEGEEFHTYIHTYTHINTNFQQGKILTKYIRREMHYKSGNDETGLIITFKAHLILTFIDKRSTWPCISPRNAHFWVSKVGIWKAQHGKNFKYEVDRKFWDILDRKEKMTDVWVTCSFKRNQGAD